jgi:YVTN family beta-propeller protein
VWAVERFDAGVNTLAGFDAKTGEVLGVVPIGRRPIGVTAPHGTGKVYTADERSNQLSVLDKASFEIVKTIPTGAATFPHHLTASPNGKLLYFGRYNTNTVGVVDTASDEMVATWAASANPLAKTHAVWITNNGKELYAANEGSTQASQGTVSKLDAETGRLIWELPIGARPSEILVTPNRKTAYVSVRNDNKLRVLDISGDDPQVVGETFIGVQPDTLQITNDGRTLVVGLALDPAAGSHGHRHARRPLRDVRRLRDQRPRMALRQWQVHVHRAREHGRGQAWGDRGRPQRHRRDPRHLAVSRRPLATRGLL